MLKLIYRCFVTGKGGMRMAMERTYIMAKPDALQRGIVSDIIGRFGALGDLGLSMRCATYILYMIG